jgi:presenilin-like A22 family membrane protease
MAEWVTSEGVRLHHPNREKGSARTTKFIVILLILVSVVLMAIQTVGAWSKLEGAQPVQIGFMIVYLVLAFQIARWSRGAVILTAALAIFVLIFAAIAGPEWFARDKSGFSNPSLNESVVGLVTLLLIPVQVLLIGFALSGFQQAWNVEEEVPGGRRDYDAPEYGGAPAAA